MTLEQFNLHITTPEGEEHDPELKRLRAELMAIKPLLDDAIQRESVTEAEELHKQALEAKAKLDAYKESLNKKEEYKTIEINGVKVELGPELGEMTWNEIPAKLEEINKTLKPGEKPWRVPTIGEFIKLGNPIGDVYDDKFSIAERENIVMDFLKGLGFPSKKYFWSSSEMSGDTAYYWLVGSNIKNTTYKYNVFTVKLVR